MSLDRLPARVYLCVSYLLLAVCVAACGGTTSTDDGAGAAEVTVDPADTSDTGGGSVDTSDGEHPDGTQPDPAVDADAASGRGDPVDDAGPDSAGAQPDAAGEDVPDEDDTSTIANDAGLSVPDAVPDAVGPDLAEVTGPPVDITEVDIEEADVEQADITKADINQADITEPDIIECIPSCAGKECGPDGCGGECGTCPAVAPLCQDGLCAIDCTPDCAGKECGPDGCGGECGVCPAIAPLCMEGLCALEETCGDGTCAVDEDCETCPADCGSCPIGGACTGSADLAIVDSVDLGDAALTAVTECLFAADAQACSEQQLVEETGLSEPCATCYAGYWVCSVQNCLAQCAPPNAASASCVACQAANCASGFESCAGFPWSDDQPAGPSCGDGTCNGTETCVTCSADCGECPVTESLYCFEINGCVFASCDPNAAPAAFQACLQEAVGDCIGQVASPAESNNWVIWQQCLGACPQDGEAADLCFIEGCIEEFSDCFSGGQYGAGQCADIAPCVQFCGGDSDCVRDCYSAASADSVASDLEVLLCASVACGSAPDFDACAGFAVAPGGECAAYFEACQGVDVVEPPLPEGAASWVSALAIADTDCCFDYDGDGVPDNGYGSLFGNLGSLLGDADLDDAFQAAIDAGSMDLVLRIEGGNLVGVAAYSDSSLVDKQAGEGTFWGVDGGAGSPVVVLDVPATLSGGEISTLPGTLKLGGADGQADAVLGLDLIEVLVSGTLTEGADGSFSVTDGKIGGLQRLESLVHGLNTSLGSCSCLGLAGGDAFELASEDKMACTAALNAASPACGPGDASLCQTLADNKGLFCTAIGIIKPDIDTDASGKADAFSVGLTFTSQPANYLGVGEDSPDTWGPGSGCGGAAGAGGLLFAMLALGWRARRRRGPH